MVLSIDGKEYNLPTDFTIKKWVELQKLTGDTDKLISSAMGIPLEFTKLMPEKTKTLAVTLIIATLYPSWNKNVNPRRISFENITLGQFVDLEIFISRDYRKTMYEIINILYPDNVNDNEMFSQYWPGVERYLKWRITLYKNYKNLFGISDDERDEMEDLLDSKLDLAYSWYDNIMTLADEKFLNIDPVLQRPLIEALNYLAWHKTKLEKEAENIKMQQAQNRIR
jgi:hypothetical protein